MLMLCLIPFQEGCRVFELHEHLLHLFKLRLLRFLKTESLPTPLWKIDISDSSIWLGPYHVSYGEQARRIFADLSADDQCYIFERVKRFFRRGTEKLLKYLPFENDVLQSCQFLSPHHSNDADLENWAKTLAKCFPKIVPQNEISTLEVEARLLQGTTEKPMDIGEYWQKMSSKMPTLSRLARVTMILPHGNAEVERVFSLLPNLVTKKRSNLSATTINAIVVIKSAMASNNVSSRNFEVTQALLEKVAKAKQAYELRLKSEMEEEAARKKKAAEKDILKTFENQKKNDSKLNELESGLKNNEKRISDIMKRKESLVKMQEEALRSLKEEEDHLKALLDEKEKMEEKKRAVAEKLMTSTLKRKAHEELKVISPKKLK